MISRVSYWLMLEKYHEKFYLTDLVFLRVVHTWLSVSMCYSAVQELARDIITQHSNNIMQHLKL